MWNPFSFLKLGFRNKKRTIAIVAIVVIAGLGGGYLLTHAQQFIDSFLDTTRIASTWNVAVDTGAGEIKLAERACDDGVWFCSAVTTCVDTLGDGGYILVKRADVGTTKQWKTANTACDKPECGTDGGQDGDQLVADNTVNFLNYPARDACKAVGGRLPTNSELSCMYTNRATFGNNFVSDDYWSDTESSGTTARYVYFSNGYAYSGNKANGAYVRCVRGW